MNLPAVTFCSSDAHTYDMIIDCQGPLNHGCKTKNMIIHEKVYNKLHCVQLNYGTDVTELQKATGEGHTHGYSLVVYQPTNTSARLNLIDNSARVVYREVKEYVYAGQQTEYILSKIVQTSLGPPYSNCNESTEYRQVNCIKDCYREAMTKICGCEYPAECEHHWSNLSHECQYAHKNSVEIESKCYQVCPVECNEVSFQLDTFDIGWNMDEQELVYYKLRVSKKFNISEYSDDELKKRMSRLFIHFDKLETTEITQSPSISLTSLISNVGGLLGKSLHSTCIFDSFSLSIHPFPTPSAPNLKFTEVNLFKSK